jgi:hypothetical protein
LVLIDDLQFVPPVVEEAWKLVVLLFLANSLEGFLSILDSFSETSVRIFSRDSFFYIRVVLSFACTCDWLIYQFYFSLTQFIFLFCSFSINLE